MVIRSAFLVFIGLGVPAAIPLGFPGALRTSERTQPERPAWKLVWSDEFDKDGAPDPAKWTYEEGFVRNRERQYYTVDRRENARVEKGMLVIEGRKEHYQAPGKGVTSEYTSASLTTSKSASWKYGRIEVKARIPTGKGTWPAIWTLGADEKEVGWPRCGEIDILENVGFDPDGIHTTIHTVDKVKGNHLGQGHRIERPKPYDDFHVYAIEWTHERIDFFYDAEKTFSVQNDPKSNLAWNFDKPHYLLINFAIGGEWGAQKGVDDSIFPQKFLIDYVRVYQAAGNQ